MEVSNLINDNFSKNTGISLLSIGALLKMGASPWLIVIVAAISIITREGKEITKEIIRFKEKKNEKGNSNNTDSAGSVPYGPG